jgi:hypothetical protein
MAGVGDVQAKGLCRSGHAGSSVHRAVQWDVLMAILSLLASDRRDAAAIVAIAAAPSPLGPARTTAVPLPRAVLRAPGA